MSLKHCPYSFIKISFKVVWVRLAINQSEIIHDKVYIMIDAWRLKLLVKTVNIIYFVSTRVIVVQRENDPVV